MKRFLLNLFITLVLFILFLSVFGLMSCTFKFVREGKSEYAKVEEIEENTQEENINDNISDDNSGEDGTFSNIAQEPEPDSDVMEEPEEDIDKEAIKQEIYNQLLDFFDFSKKQQEYKFFSSYTRAMVGNEKEYLSGENSDIYFLIQENHINWENIEFEGLKIYKERATIEILGSRILEGTRYDNEKQEFKFINEEGNWKIDFFYPPVAEVIPLSPLPDSISDYKGLIEIEFDIISFFSINAIELYLNDKPYNPDDIKTESKYNKKVIKKIPSFNAYRSLNTIKVKVINKFDEEYDFYWSFVLG